MNHSKYVLLCGTAAVCLLAAPALAQTAPVAQTQTNVIETVVVTAEKRAQNVQDVFSNHVRKNKLPVTVFLVNGVKLQGVISWFDNFCVLLRRDGHVQLVYKHAISTVMPAGPVQLFDPAEDAGETA